MIRKDGKVYEAVAELLMERGMDLEGLAVACTNRGCDHLVLLSGETVGEYNHVSRRLLLYSDMGLPDA